MTSSLQTIAVEKSPRESNSCQPLISFKSISKSFEGAIALADVSFDVAQGTMHALVGENGAGKTTLMRILSGSLRPDGGAINIDGISRSFRSPAHALRDGIGMVYQNFSLISSLTVLDNILLGDCRNSFHLRRRHKAEEVEHVAKHFGFDFDLSAPTWRLGMAERQKLEIFKLLWRDAQILILDEPTSQLPPFEAEDILDTLTELARKGRTVLLVSHHLQEVLRFCTRITVLRRGRLVATVDPRTTSVSDLAGMVVGALPACSQHNQRSMPTGLPLLSLRDVSVRPATGIRALRQITLDIHAREMIGVAGVIGSGQDELVGVLTGQLPVSRGELLLDGQLSPWKVLRQTNSPVAHIPADSRGTGTISRLSLCDNLFLREAVRANGLLGPILFPRAMRQQAESWKILGWFQGRFEWGPRALGNRSILADPRPAGMKDIVNARIKFREPFRPFAPAALAEHADEWFLPANLFGQPTARFMLCVCQVRPERRGQVPAVVHVDGSARPQLVTRDANPLYYSLIERFFQATGVPMLLNTSFNLKGEPIVASPADALSTFRRCDMNVLYLGCYRVTKPAPGGLVS